MKIGLAIIAAMIAASGAAAATPAKVAADAPKAIGPYVQAVAAGNTLYLSGQLPIDPATGALVAGGIEAQTTAVLRNLRAVLIANGLTLDDVVMSNVYLVNLADFPAMNRIYATHFTQPPARATVEIKGLALGALIEISMIAVRPKAQ